MSNPTATVVCDNKGVLHKCTHGNFRRLRNHREEKIDLYYTQQAIHKSIKINDQWVKSHIDTKPWYTVADLQSQLSNRDNIYNVWCDRAANKAWLKGDQSLPNPEVSIEEKWAVYSNYPSFHKITGNLTEGDISTMGYTPLLKYLQHKHSIYAGKLDRINLLALQEYLNKLKYQKRALIIKLIHDWVPTYATLSH